ncbi:hypothetical protein COXBURSA331_A0777 [Coxiella burnetii RSA 331]|nr:hypothetical protein COXBURSA331_A0777 [Coxiella burnetii RSA 331]
MALHIQGHGVREFESGLGFRVKQPNSQTGYRCKSHAHWENPQSVWVKQPIGQSH